MKVIIGCDHWSFSLHTRDIPPAQAFPQPPLKLTIGETVWILSPDPKMVGRQATLQADFNVGDDAMRDRAMLRALRRGPAPKIDFNGYAQELPSIPVAMGKEVADYCDKLWDLGP